MKDQQENIRPDWIDLHCHLDLYPDHAKLIAECDLQRVATLAVTTTPKAWPRNHELASRSKMVRAALGLHPQLADERADELALFEKSLHETRYVGEVGLDAGPRFYRSFDTQERVFSRILRACAEHGNKILSIHSIRAASKVLDHLERALPPDRSKCVLHWFTGTASEAKRALAYGCYFSVNSEMLRNERHRTLVSAIPLNRILTETDGPFVLIEGQPVRPKHVATTVALIAKLHGMDAAVIATRLRENLRELLT